MSNHSPYAEFYRILSQPKQYAYAKCRGPMLYANEKHDPKTGQFAPGGGIPEQQPGYDIDPEQPQQEQPQPKQKPDSLEEINLLLGKDNLSDEDLKRAE